MPFLNLLLACDVTPTVCLSDCCRYILNTYGLINTHACQASVVKYRTTWCMKRKLQQFITVIGNEDNSIIITWRSRALLSLYILQIWNQYTMKYYYKNTSCKCPSYFGKRQWQTQTWDLLDMTTHLGLNNNGGYLAFLKHFSKETSFSFDKVGSKNNKSALMFLTSC